MSVTVVEQSVTDQATGPPNGHLSVINGDEEGGQNCINLRTGINLKSQELPVLSILTSLVNVF